MYGMCVHDLQFHLCIIYVRNNMLMVCAHEKKLLWDVKDGIYIPR